MQRRTRIALVAGFVLLAGVSLGVQAATIDRGTQVRAADGGNATPYPGNTLVGVHSWGNDGRLVELDREGEVVWEHRIDDARVFGIDPVRAGESAVGVEPESDGRVVLFAVGEVVPAADCPAEFLTHETRYQGFLNAQEHCVLNRVVLFDRSDREVLWEYSWYDEMIHHHEVHDAVVTDDGEVAIVDMGNDRAFTVNESGAITWEWQAEAHLDRGTPFFEERVPEDRADEFAKAGPHDDWTHMNDIDQLSDGTFQLSIRNYDSVIRVDPETNEIVEVVGGPGRTSLMNHQHNPQRLEDAGTMLVADSENDRIVEIDVETEEIVWTYRGPPGDPLTWPRDGDRLPNGNTLITDSQNNRVLEVSPDGEVVWSFRDPDGKVIPLPYAAERLPAGEAAGGPSAREFDTGAGDGETADGADAAGASAGTDGTGGGVAATLRRVETFGHWVLPTWMHLPQQLNLLALVLGTAWLGGEAAAAGLRRIRRARA